MRAKAKAFSYVRFSTPEQAKGDSFRRQTQLAFDYAARHGLLLDDELRLQDLGKSAYRGANIETGSLGAFLRAVHDGLVPPGSLLLVEALDRISRKSARQAVRVLEEIVDAGVDVVTLADGKRYSKASLDGFDFVMALLLMIRGHEESETKSRRLKEAWHGKRALLADGKRLTKLAPGWIDASAAKPRLIPDRAKIVRRMFREYLSGKGKEAIAEGLNADSVPTFGRGASQARYWHRSYIHKTLSNRTVLGEFTPHIERHVDGRLNRIPQEPIPGYYPRCIDEETFMRAQALRGSKVSGTSTRAAAVNLLAGLARCPKCGGAMTRIMKGARGGTPRLVCLRAKTGAGCEYHSVRQVDVERALIGRADELNPPAANADDAGELQGLEAAEHETAKAVSTLVDLIERKPSAALSQRLAQRESELAAIEGELRELRARMSQTESKVLAARAARLRDALTWHGTDPSDVAGVNAALRECFSSVVVDYGRGGLMMNWRQGGTTEVVFAMGE